MKEIIGKFKSGKFLFLIAGLVFAFSLNSNFVKAENRIDVEYPVGTNLNGDEIFKADNIMPGWEESKTIRVENDSTTDDVNLYFTFDVHSGADTEDLAKELKLYVIRLENGSYRIGGEGDRYDLEEADEKRLYVDKLSATKGKQYRIKIKFDEGAGNEYQNLTTEFDIDFEIESEAVNDETEDAILSSQGRVGFTGNAPSEEAEGNGEGETVIDEGAEVEGTENDADVLGEKDNNGNSLFGDWKFWLVAVLIGGAGWFFYNKRMKNKML